MWEWGRGGVRSGLWGRGGRGAGGRGDAGDAGEAFEAVIESCVREVLDGRATGRADQAFGEAPDFDGVEPWVDGVHGDQ